MILNGILSNQANTLQFSLDFLGALSSFPVLIPSSVSDHLDKYPVNPVILSEIYLLSPCSP